MMDGPDLNTRPSASIDRATSPSGAIPLSSQRPSSLEQIREVPDMRRRRFKDNHKA